MPAPMADDGQPPLIAIDDRQTDAIDIDGLRALARECLVGERIVDAELSISFVTEDEIADLHRRYLQQDGPTDVLSFPLDDEAGEDGLRILGDVVISPAVASLKRPEGPGSELRVLLVHGIVDMLGQDHREKEDRATMWARQERYSGVRVR